MRSPRPASIGVLFLCLAAAPQAPAQESAALYDAAVVVLSNDKRMDALLDLDGDGDLDAVGVWHETLDAEPYLSTFSNDGSGRFVPHDRVRLGYRTIPYGHRIVVGNLDGTGGDDFAIKVASQVRIYSGALDLTPYATISLPFDVRDFALGDFDGDGLDDVVVGYAAVVEIYLNGGDGRFAFASQSQTWNSAGTLRFFEAEVDGDGLADVGAVNFTSAHSYVSLFPAAGGVFGARTDFLLGDFTDAAAASGDVDLDGDLDVVFFRRQGYVTFRRIGPAEFAVEAETPGGPATGLADVDGDGDLDGVCCGGGGTPEPPKNVGPSVFEIALNDGTGRFAPSFKIPGLGARRLAGARDVDGDGDVDLVAGRCVYYGNGPMRDPYPRIPDWGASPADVLPIVDADGDGDVDARFGLSTSRSNRADCTFIVLPPAVPSPPGGTRFAGPGLPGDFDGDGDCDLLVCHETPNGSTLFAMRLLLNLGGGSFVDGGDAAPPGERMFRSGDPRTIHVVADLDDDGDVDVVARTTPSGLGSGRAWMNGGSGFFSAGVAFPDENVLGVADLDGDGVSDLVTHRLAAASDVRLDLRRGTGGGGFALGETLAGSTESIANALSIADLDGDGDLDLVTDRPPFRILANDGAGVFVESRPFGNLDRPWWLEFSVLVTDANGDGHPDVIVSPPDRTENSVSRIYLWSGPGVRYATSVRQVMKGVALADADGDGDDDLLSDTYVTSSDSSDPSYSSDHFIRSRRFDAPGSGAVRQYGGGVAGSGGLVPIVGAASPFRPGVPREYRVTNGLGNARAFLAIGRNRISESRRGGVLLVDPFEVRKIRLDGSAGSPGAGCYVLAEGPAPAHLARKTFYLQVVVRDPAGPAGFSFSNGLKVTFGD